MVAIFRWPISDEMAGEPLNFSVIIVINLATLKSIAGMKGKHAKFAEKEPNNESETLFMACYTATMCLSEVWFIDSSCSNHMRTTYKLSPVWTRSCKPK